MNRVSKALEIHKEMPFYTYIPANEVYDIEEKENILVQGIMDLYFIDEAGKLVLVDYKTDYVQNKEELIEKYKVQLEIYKKALEESLAKKVDEVYLYSIFLNEELKVEFE
jgi:ATP-dependent helicase/nuclease subunit A